jgi:lauroyl/myristoyl acyltransferase
LGRAVKFEPGLLEALPVGQPVVLATAHTGNWDLLACAAAEQAPLTVVTKHLRRRLALYTWIELRVDAP